MGMPMRWRYSPQTLPPLPPSDGYKRRRDLADSALRRKQIELRRCIARVLYLEPHTEAVEVLAHSRCKGRDGGAGANNE